MKNLNPAQVFFKEFVKLKRELESQGYEVDVSQQEIFAKFNRKKNKHKTPAHVIESLVKEELTDSFAKPLLKDEVILENTGGKRVSLKEPIVIKQRPGESEAVANAKFLNEMIPKIDQQNIGGDLARQLERIEAEFPGSMNKLQNGKIDQSTFQLDLEKVAEREQELPIKALIERTPMFQNITPEGIQARIEHTASKRADTYESMLNITAGDRDVIRQLLENSLVYKRHFRPEISSEQAQAEMLQEMRDMNQALPTADPTAIEELKNILRTARGGNVLGLQHQFDLLIESIL